MKKLTVSDRRVIELLKARSKIPTLSQYEKIQSNK